MKTSSSLGPCLLGLVAAFAYLFHHWPVGINVFIFDGALLLVVLRFRPELARRASFRWAVAALLPSALSIVVVHSTTSLIAHTASLLLLVGFAQERELRFVWYGLVLGAFSVFAAPFRMLDRSRKESGKSPQCPALFRWLRHAVAPVFIVIPLLFLYLIGSDDFLGLFGALVFRLVNVLDATSLPHTLGVAAIGFLLILPLFFVADEVGLSDKEGALSDTLQRHRRSRKIRFRPTALLSHYRRGVVTLGLLNGLILITNLTDLRYIWLETNALSPAQLSQYVHAGTTSLVLSILLAMVVVLYYFRGNLNFYRGNLLLRRLTYLWLAQNAFLALSVGVRNWHYVSAYGLAYGRIQIAFVLLLILVGLYTLYRKVRHALSLSFLLLANGLALWLFLIAFGAVNWPGIITRVNLTQAPAEVDWDYLITDLDERNLFLLDAEAKRLPSRLTWKIQDKIRRARKAQQNEDWRGWNYPDYRNRKRLN